MSDTVLAALIALGGVIIGASLTIVNSIISSKLVKKNIEMEHKEKFKYVALEKRLEIHQEAYALCHEIMNNLHKDQHSQTYNKCMGWWLKNNLYLETKARKAFRDYVYESGIFIMIPKSSNPKVEEKKINFTEKLFPETLQLISDGIGLPWVKDIEIHKNQKS
jgi:hypothetical protein